MRKELRELVFKTEVRALAEEGKPNSIVGIIPYNKMSEDLGGFREVITPTAFKRTISIGNDIKALYNHDSNFVLGRTKNSSLSFADTADGLVCSCQLPDTDYARNAYNLIKDGYIDTLSFGFNLIEQTVEVDKNGNQTNYLTEVALREVSFCVPFPAYPQTQAMARSIVMNKRNIDIEKLEAILAKDDDEISKRDMTALAAYIDMLNDLVNGPDKQDAEAELTGKETVIDTSSSTDQNTGILVMLQSLYDSLKA